MELPGAPISKLNGCILARYIDKSNPFPGVCRHLFIASILDRIGNIGLGSDRPGLRSTQALNDQVGLGFGFDNRGLCCCPNVVGNASRFISISIGIGLHKEIHRALCKPIGRHIQARCVRLIRLQPARAAQRAQ